MHLQDFVGVAQGFNGGITTTIKHAIKLKIIAATTSNCNKT